MTRRIGFLEFTSWLVGYGFDDLDWDAVSVGRADADRNDESFDYYLGPVAVWLRGTYLVHFDLTAKQEIERVVEVAVRLMQSYHCTPTFA